MEIDRISGILNVDKPAGLSSARVVDRAKRLLPRGTKIGHAGTLDPFATGVLLLLVGKGTKLCEQLMGQPKQYETTVKLGATTETLDPESEEIPVPPAAIPTPEAVQSAVAAMTGTVMQRPPAFSAMKVGGRRAYDLARQGKTVDLPPRPVQIYRMELLAYTWPTLSLRIDCGRGTYVRSIARDLGEALGTSGYLLELRRTRIGRFDLATAKTLEQLGQGDVRDHLQPLE
jgi:tRNA pseudouridine55 synthase